MRRTAGEMFIKNFIVSVILICLFGVSFAEAAETNLTSAKTTESKNSAIKKAGTPEDWEFRAITKYFFASNTTYEFGNPNIEGSDKPLSRLSFPLNTVFAGGEVRRNFTGFSLGFTALSSVMRNTSGRLKDSDWEDTGNPDLRTTYSLSACRMDRGLVLGGDADFTIAEWIGLPDCLDFRPLVGLEWQQFYFTGHDCLQFDYSSGLPDSSFPEDVVDFRQNYLEYMLGCRTIWDMGRPFKLPPIKSETEVRWSIVTGDDEDHHLLRPGKRLTAELTSGWGFYVSTGLRMDIAKNVSIGCGVDYHVIRTWGVHRWLDSATGTDMKWKNAVKVWSDQSSVNMDITCKF